MFWGSFNEQVSWMVLNPFPTKPWLQHEDAENKGKTKKVINFMPNCESDVVNTMTKSKPGRKGSICLTPPHGSSPSNKTKARGRSRCRGHGGCCWLACSSWLVQPAFLQNARPDQGWPRPQWAGSSPSPSTGLPTVRSYRSIFSLGAPSSQMTVAWVMLT